MNNVLSNLFSYLLITKLMNKNVYALYGQMIGPRNFKLYLITFIFNINILISKWSMLKLCNKKN